MFFEYKLHFITPSSLYILSCGAAIGSKFIPNEYRVPTVNTYQNGVTVNAFVYGIYWTLRV